MTDTPNRIPDGSPAEKTSGIIDTEICHHFIGEALETALEYANLSGETFVNWTADPVARTVTFSALPEIS